MKKLRNIIAGIVVIEMFFQALSFGRYVYYKILFDSRTRQEQQDKWIFSDPSFSWWLDESKHIQGSFAPFLGWKTDTIGTDNIHVEDGIRKTTGNPQDISEDTKTVYMLGGSTTWGYNLKDDQTIPSFLAKLLNESSRGSWNIVNYGEIAYTSTHEIFKLQLMLQAKKIPDLVIFYDGCNDLRSHTPFGRQNNMHFEKTLAGKLGDIYKYFIEQPPKNLSLISTDGVKEIFDFLYTYVKVVRYPFKLAEALFRGKTKSLSSPSVFDDQTAEQAARELTDNYIQNARMIESLASMYDFQYMLVWQPQLFNKTPLSDKEKKLVPLYEEENGLIWAKSAEMLRSNNISHFYDLTGAFSNNEHTIFSDRCHTTAEGNLVIAERLRDIIIQRY